MSDPRLEVVERLRHVARRRLAGDPTVDDLWLTRRLWSSPAERSIALGDVIGELRAAFAMATAAIDQQDAGPKYDPVRNRFVSFDEAAWLDSIGVAYDECQTGDA